MTWPGEFMASPSLVVGGVGAAWRFLARAWARAWASMLTVGALFGAVWALGLLSPHSAWRPLALLTLAAGAIMVEGGLYRLALGVGRLGPAGLQWGRAEWRLGAVWGLTAVFLFVLGLLAFAVFLAFGYGVAAAGPGFVASEPATWTAAVDGRGRVVLAGVAALCFAALVWAGVRVSLGGPATVDVGRVQVLATWPATRRLVAPIVVGRVVLGLGPIGFASVVLWSQSRWSLSPALLWMESLAGGVVVAGLWLPLSVGLMAYLYRRSLEA